MKFLRKNIEQMKPYVPGFQPKDMSVIKLNTNENPYPPSPLVQKVLKDFNFEKLRLYPNPESYELKKIIADVYGFDINQIFIGNGSDEILSLILKAFVELKEKIGFVYPTYFLYQVLADIHGCKTMQVNFKKINQLKKVKVLFLANPNPPTGFMIPLKQVENIVKNHQGLVVIDEAYVDFAKENCLSLVKKYKNVIVVRTCSKSFSLAGIRLGYAFGHKDLIQGLCKVKDSYNINRLTQEIGIAAMNDISSMKRNAEKIKKTRERISKKLRDMNFWVAESQANFIYVEHKRLEAKYIFKELEKRKILVRYFDRALVDQGLRISIGSDDQMNQLIKALEEILKK